MRRWVRSMVTSLMVMACCVAMAHHSFPATYLMDQEISVDGVVVQLLFRNPHSFVHVLAPDSEGTMQRWAIEWAGAGALARTNVSHETLKPGDRVRVTGHPSRNAADHRMVLRAIERPSDGWKWSTSFE